MLYFTSDLHLGHEKAIFYQNRPFADAGQMNQALIQNINEMVGPEDELWILGDFAYRIGREQVHELRMQIRCRHIHLIRGNHDGDIEESLFESVQDYKELDTKYGKLVLFHYPIAQWNGAHFGSIHLHGHIHSSGDYNAKKQQETLRIYDVGVDANHYRPISLAQLANLLPDR